MGAEICFKDTESFLNGCIVWMFCGCVLVLCCKNGPVGSGVPPWDRCGETQCLTEQEEAGVRFWASFLPETSKRSFWIQIFCSMKGNFGGSHTFWRIAVEILNLNVVEERKLKKLRCKKWFCHGLGGHAIMPWKSWPFLSQTTLPVLIISRRGYNLFLEDSCITHCR